MQPTTAPVNNEPNFGPYQLDFDQIGLTHAECKKIAQSVSERRSRGGPQDRQKARSDSVGVGLSTRVTSNTLAIPREPQKKRMKRMARVVGAAANGIQAQMTSEKRRFKAAMITLTYRPGQHWEPHDISKLMKCYREWLNRRGVKLRAVWVAELQKRGAVHYHVLIWLPRGLTPPKPDKRGWWRKGSTNTKWARKPVNYIRKYCSKIKSKTGGFPAGCRLYGCYGVPIHLGWWRAPHWLSQQTEPGSVIRRRGAWWIAEGTGYGFRSPWVVEDFTATTITIRWFGWPPGRMLPIADIEENWEQWQEEERAFRIARKSDGWEDNILPYTPGIESDYQP